MYQTVTDFYKQQRKKGLTGTACSAYDIGGTAKSFGILLDESV